MHNLANTVLWVYIVLLVIGGMIGFLKGKSQVSLIMSVTFAVLLIVTAIPNLLTASVARGITDALMAALLVVFSLRLIKTKKFMPSGLMLLITLAALVLRHVQ
ncbi:MAG TPA: TMEM14 family protein [Verrucomicrobiae bacterium]|nr:TMEM14 family protein [Verrucomicrobiae bacterium]